MFLKLVKATAMEIEGVRYLARYFEQQTARGARRYSCEVMLGVGDRIILDDDSMMSLESKMARLVPAMVYSRLLAARRAQAA